MNIQEILQNHLNLVGETQYNSRHHLVQTLKQIIFTGEIKTKLGKDNMYDYWVSHLNDKFFDMGTFIRLGSTIEGNFKRYYMYKKGYTNNLELFADKNYDKGIFSTCSGR